MRQNIVKWTVPTFNIGNQPKDIHNFKSQTLPLEKILAYLRLPLYTFHATGFSLHPLKTSENKRFSVFSGYRSDQWNEMG